MSLPASEQLVPLIRSVAAEELLSRFQRVGFEVKADKSLVTEADFAVQRRLEEELHSRWPAIGFLGEEMAAEAQQAALEGGAPFWCLDPVDGTSNFVAGIPYFCISLALVADGQPLAAVIYDPWRDECFRADRNRGAYLNERRLDATTERVPHLAQAIALVDFKRLPQSLARRMAAEPPFASQRNFGSSALDWAWLAAGRGHAYLHGGQKLWDYAGGVLLLAEAGGVSATLEGEPVFVRRLGSRSVVAARNAELFGEWVEAVSALGVRR